MSYRAAGLRALRITASPNFGGNANFGGSGGTVPGDAGANSDNSGGGGQVFSWTQVVVCVGLTILFVLLYFLYLVYRRRHIQSYMIERERRAHAASLQYIGDQVVDAETLKEIRTRVVQIIFPPGVTVQDDEANTKEKPSKKKASSTPTITEVIEPESTTSTTASQQEHAETVAETTADDQANHQDDEEEGEKPSVAEETNEEEEKQVIAEKTNEEEEESEKPAATEKTNENSTTDILSKAEAMEQPSSYYDVESNNTVVEQEDGKAAAPIVDDSERSEYVRECAICLGEYNVGDETASSKNCSHVFHRECLLEWSAFKKECPICRTEMWDQHEFERLQKDMLSEQQQQETSAAADPENRV